ncbi:MAG TPA: hypothetical protein GXZ65_00640 [Clostridiales bacterium]|jgi:cell division protein FtsL|nr:hypothetical protein [Clostridiales bacterium]
MYAGEAKTMKYASATFGSLAYDLGTAAPRAVPEAPPVILPRPGREARKEKIKIDELPRRRVRSARVAVSPFTAVGFAVAAVLLFLVVMGYVQMAAISYESAELQQQLAELNEIENRLKIEYESTFDLDKIEQFAVNELGMVPAANSQVFYINSSAPDKAEILRGNTESGGLFDNLTAFLSRVVEYFR